MKVGVAQLSPIWLNKAKTTVKIIEYIQEAGDLRCDLLVFGEGLLPGYPFWLAFTDGATFNSQMQKEIYAHYVTESVDMTNGDLDMICAAAKENNLAIYLGIIERAADRGGHSLYCTLVYIDKYGVIQSTHRKLQPTYEERLVWAPGDGQGLVVHQLEEFTVGGLNCWENWMPLSRTALYAQGENLHIAVWPGCLRNTKDITEFIAKESRSYVMSVSGLYRKEDVGDELPYADLLREAIPENIANGGSGIVSPKGEWLMEPIIDKEGLFVAELDLQLVYQERQNFDVSGHYARPDVTKLTVNRSRQSLIALQDDDEKKT
jgi:nitrilase